MSGALPLAFSTFRDCSAEAHGVPQESANMKTQDYRGGFTGSGGQCCVHSKSLKFQKEIVIAYGDALLHYTREWA